MTTTNQSEYDVQAEQFLATTETTITKSFLRRAKYFHKDTEERNIRSITLSNKHHTYTFEYGDSIQNTNNKCSIKQVANAFSSRLAERIYNSIILYKLNPYNETDCSKAIRLNNTIGSMLYLKFIDFLIPHTPDTYSILACLQPVHENSFADRCQSFGYSEDSIQAKAIYDKCIVEDSALRKLFNRAHLRLLEEIL